MRCAASRYRKWALSWPAQGALPPACRPVLRHQTCEELTRVIVSVPKRLAQSCAGHPEREAWLRRLPEVVEALVNRWSLKVGAPFANGEGSCAWVAPVRRSDGSPAVLKLGMPHMEAEHEIDGLRFWQGDPTVMLFEADEALNAMLLERCEPGTHLRNLPEPEQDQILAGLLRRVWRPVPALHPFRPLARMTDHWSSLALATQRRWKDPALVADGLALFHELPRNAPVHVLLATDLHAGNVLRARREPWLVIDPKPFVGDPAYDATQHLFNCLDRLQADPEGTIERYAGLLEVDPERVRLWTFARAAVMSASDEFSESEVDRWTSLARIVAP